MKKSRKRLALGISIPVVLLFIGILVALLMPFNLFVVTEALSDLGLLGGRKRVDGLVDAPPGPAAPPPLRIVNGMLWDAPGGLRPNPGLAVVSGRIAVSAPPGARTIDAAGMTVMPGLIDMHVHSLGGTFAGEMWIGNGVTTARDLGTHLAGVIQHREESAGGERVGPRLFVSGPYLVGGEASSDQEISASDPESAISAVSRLSEAGVDGIKLHWGNTAETLRAASETAHRRGLWVAAHLDGVGAAEAARLGADTIEHVSGIGWDAGSAEQDEAIEAMVSRGVALTPTLVVAEHAFTLPDLVSVGDPEMLYFPRFFRRFWISSQIRNAAASRLTRLEADLRRARLERLKSFVGRFRRAGGRVLVGTDAPAYLVAPGFDIHRELELLVASGLTWEEALSAATHAAALVLGRGEEIGALRAGMRADLILVEGGSLSGLEGVSPTRRIVMVISSGRILLDRTSKLTTQDPRR